MIIIIIIFLYIFIILYYIYNYNYNILIYRIINYIIITFSIIILIINTLKKYIDYKYTKTIIKCNQSYHHLQENKYYHWHLNK